MSFKQNETYTVDNQSPVTDHYSPPDCGKHLTLEDHSANRLADQHLNGTFTINSGDYLIHNQSFNSACNSQKPSPCDISQFRTCPTPSTVDSCSCQVQSNSPSLNKSSPTFNPNKAFISLSSYFHNRQSQNSTDSAVEKCQSCQQPSAHAIHRCEAVYSESRQLLSTYTIGSCGSQSGQSSQLLSTYTVDSHAYTYTMDSTGIEIFQNCSNGQSSQSGEKKEDTYESKLFPSDQLPNASLTKSSKLTSRCQGMKCASSSSSLSKSCADQFEHNQSNQFSKANLNDVNKTNETDQSQSCLEKNQTGNYQCCERSEKSAIDFCSDSNNCSFPCANPVVEKISSETFLVEKSDSVISQSQTHSPSSESFKDKSDSNSDSKSVADCETLAGWNDGAKLQDTQNKHCSGSKYDVISARLLELFTRGTSAAGKCSCCPVAPLNSSKVAIDSKPVSPKPGNECDKSNGDPKSSSTNCSGKSPLSKDLFSSVEIFSELENAGGKKKISPGLSQDSLFVITSQGRAYNHFKAKLQAQGNVQSSTQGNLKERLTADARGSSSETQFSPLENEVGEKSSPHFRMDNEVAAKKETPSFPNASPLKSALLLNEQKSNGSVGTPPVSERDSLVVNIPESIAPISEARPQFTSEASGQSVTNAQFANVTPFLNKKTSLSTPKVNRSKPDGGLTSPSSSLCTVVEVEPESVRKQNKHGINQDTSDVTRAEKETAVSALNTAYIAEEAEVGEDTSFHQKKILLRENKIQSFKKFKKKQRLSQNSQRSSSVTKSSGETSKPSNKTSSSSKTRSSSTNTSSCIVESSIVDPLKKWKTKKDTWVSNRRENHAPRRKRKQLFKRRKTVSSRKMKRQSEQVTNSSLSTVYSSLNSNSGQAIEDIEARKIDRRPEFIDLTADPEPKLPRRKRRRLFKRFKILQRRRKHRQMEKNLRSKRQCVFNADCIEPEPPYEPNCVTNKTSHTSSSSVSVIETSVPNDLVLRNNRTIRERAVSNSQESSNESYISSPRRSQKKLARETFEPDNLPLSPDLMIEEKTVSVLDDMILNESCTSNSGRSQRKLASETSMPDNLPLSHDITMKKRTTSTSNKSVLNESYTNSPRRSQRKLTPETSMPNDLLLSHDGTVKDRTATDSNKTVLNDSYASSPRRSQRKLTPETSMANDLSLSHDSTVKDRTVTANNKTVLNESCANSPRRSQRKLTPEISLPNDLPLSHDSTIKDRTATVNDKAVLNESRANSPRRSQRKLTPEISLLNDLPLSHDSTIKDRTATVNNKTVLNESCANSPRRSQRKLTPEISLPNDLPLSHDSTMKDRTATVDNKTVLNESCANSPRRSQRKFTPEMSLPNDLPLSDGSTVKAVKVTVNKTILNESCTSGLRRSQRKLTPETCTSNELPLSHADAVKERTVTASKRTISCVSLMSSSGRIVKKCTPVESSSTPKPQIVRLSSLNYFCINVRALSEEFLEFHGFLPKLCLQRVVVQGKKRKRLVSDCYVLLEDCMGRKNDSPSSKICSLISSPKRRKISSPPSETLSFFSNPKKRVSLSSSRKDSALGSESRSSCQKPAENPVKAPSYADQIPCSSKEEKKNCDRIDNDKACSSSGVEKDSVKLTSDMGLKSGPHENSLSVKACLVQISPRISGNIVSAVCCHCNKLIPYCLTETEFVAGGTIWPNSMAPVCPSANCNRRKLYWGIFKTKLVLKTQNGEYLIAQTTTPDAEKFFGCTVREFFEDVKHERQIKERIAQLLVSQKKREDIIFKNYNLTVHQSEDALRIRIVNTNLFDP